MSEDGTLTLHEKVAIAEGLRQIQSQAGSPLEQQLLKKREALIAYTKAQLDSGDDWHAAIDSLMDLRDVDAKLEILREIR